MRHHLLRHHLFGRQRPRILGKQVQAAALAGLMGITMALAVPGLPDAMAAAWNKVDGYYQLPSGDAIENVLARGIDVSHWKQAIDWDAVAADDVQFVMLGTRYAGDVDPYFRANAMSAARAGLRVGAYIYSYATTPEMAVEEADFILDLIKDYPISFPVAFDVEASVQSTLAPGELSAIINAFCDKVAAAGYHPMVYANDHWLANKIDMSQVKYDVWVARYQVKHVFPNPAMWQATSTGSVAGVEGNVDIDFLYKDLSPLLPPNLWRTIGGKQYFYQDYVMQRENWINDGAGWYYMGQDGLAAKGWLDQPGARYYLDQASGKMATGWKQLGNQWYYFADNGAMAKGWVDVDNARYYLGQDGAMATGWLDDQGMRYYLRTDGSMATGWRQMGKDWYFFQPTGPMATGWIKPDGNWYYLAQDGKMQTGWVEDDRSHYYLSTSSGKMTVGWRELGGSWYYFGPSGAMATGPVEVDGHYYYLSPVDGKMAANTTLALDGVEYSIDGNGVMAKTEAASQTPKPSPAPGGDSLEPAHAPGTLPPGGSSAGSPGSTGAGSPATPLPSAPSQNQPENPADQKVVGPGAGL